MRIRTKIFLAVLLLFFAFIVFQLPFASLVGKKHVISTSTTRITEPIRDDGAVDYLAAINRMLSEGVTVDNNALIALSGALKFETISPQLEREFFEHLGVVDLPEVDYLVDVQSYVNSHFPTSDETELEARNELESELHQRPWTTTDYPKWSKWLADESPSLDLIVEASHRPRYYHPLVNAGDYSQRSLTTTPLHAAQCLRGAARGLSTRAMNSIGEGRVDQAIRDTQSIRRLARLSQQSFTPIEMLIGAALHGMAAKCEEQLLASGLMSQEHLAQYDQFLSGNQSNPSLAERLNTGERFMMLDLLQTGNLYGLDFQSLTTGSYGKHLSSLNSLSGLINWNEAMRYTNREYDALAKLTAEADVRKRLDLLEEYESKLASDEEYFNVANTTMSMIGGANSRGRWVGRLMLQFFVPAMSQLSTADIRTEIHRDLIRAGIGLEQYKLKHGTYPDDLEQLSSEFDKVNLRDPYTGELLKYKRSSTGYTLYSIGSDGIDNGGISFEERERAKWEFDIRIRIGSEK